MRMPPYPPPSTASHVQSVMSDSKALGRRDFAVFLSPDGVRCSGPQCLNLAAASKAWPTPGRQNAVAPKARAPYPIQACPASDAQLVAMVPTLFPGPRARCPPLCHELVASHNSTCPLFSGTLPLSTVISPRVSESVALGLEGLHNR